MRTFPLNHFSSTNSSSYTGVQHTLENVLQCKFYAHVVLEIGICITWHLYKVLILILHIESILFAYLYFQKHMLGSHCRICTKINNKVKEYKNVCKHIWSRSTYYFIHMLYEEKKNTDCNCDALEIEEFAKQLFFFLVHFFLFFFCFFFLVLCFFFLFLSTFISFYVFSRSIQPSFMPICVMRDCSLTHKQPFTVPFISNT